MTDPTPPTTGADDMRDALAEHFDCDYVITDDGDAMAFECGVQVPVSVSLTQGRRDHLAAALAAHVAAVVAEKTAEVERLRTRRGDCICDYNPETTDGPSEDCPQHGRPYSYWVEGATQALGVVAAVKALADRWESHARSFTSPVDLRVRQDWEHIVRSLRAVLGPVSGAVEGAGQNPPNAMMTPYAQHAPVAEHEQEVRAEERARVAERIKALRRSDASWDDNRELTRGRLQGMDAAAALAARTPEAGS